ncbi:DNA-binding transcriptional LysR family regulator [Caldalkalibacillus uzonensis]|uniref:DNA-binding transcriptional LysR family regulator n=1 Tax=Caldalkalibacillus uzonensis TaxID=353224 RepID=A0ABU0CNG4_9BACI|nr:selenium metabolism-associated LysR family transcriptional regulator [Caldalkalibacillus uzonensis]MDQ0337957.1 DNA-binding transcriptional LysR family regulator [Caldalkalibacillus uzonensis]
MNYEHIKTFLIVAEKKSFTKTAQLLHLSQPTVTAHIKALERHLNTTLFERNTKSVALTPAAKILYRYAKEIIKLCELAENEILNMSQTIQGRLTIACSLTIGENILPLVLKELKQNFPYLQLNVDITNTTQIIQRIKAHTLDIGLIEAPVDDPSLILEPFMEDKLVLISSPNYFEIAKCYVTKDEMTQLPLILREQGSGTRTVMEKHLAQAGVELEDLNIILELGSTESVKSAVESNLGVSILSRTAIKKELKLNLLKAYPIKDLSFSRHFYIVYHRDTVLKPTDQALIQTVKALNKIEEDASPSKSPTP